MDKDKKKKPNDKNNDEQENASENLANENTEATDDNPPMVALTFDEYEALEKEIESLQKEVEETKDQWLRTRADFDNYKKRVLRDASRSYQDAMTSIIKIFLSIADDLERALKNQTENKEAASWVEGIELINQKLLTQFKNQSVERMVVNPGDGFDPNIHEAITQEDHPDFEEGQIIEVVQPGYRISDRIIRPAMVRVAR